MSINSSVTRKKLTKQLFVMPLLFSALLVCPVSIARDAIILPANISPADLNVSQAEPSSPLPSLTGLVSVGILSKASSENDFGSEIIGSGNFLFSPKKMMIIKTAFGEVSISARSVLLLCINPRSMALYCLDEEHAKGISVQADRKIFSLSSGEHLTITDSNTDKFASVNAVAEISHRKIRSENTDQHMFYKSEFNIFTAINHSRLRNIFGAPKTHEQKALVNHLLKVAAIQTNLANGGGRLIQADGPVTFQFVTK